MKAFEPVEGGYHAVLDPLECCLIVAGVERAQAALGRPQAAGNPAGAQAASRADEQAEDFLRGLGSQTHATASASVPELAWLRPSASHDDPELAAEFARLTQADLEQARITRLAALGQMVKDSIGGRGTPCHLQVDYQDTDAMLAALNDTRLVLAGYLGIHTPADAVAAGRLEPPEGESKVRVETLEYVMVSGLADTLAEAVLEGPGGVANLGGPVRGPHPGAGGPPGTRDDLGTHGQGVGDAGE